MIRRLTSAPKPSSRVLKYIFRKLVRLLGPKPVSNAVVAGEVRRRLGRRDDVIDRDAVFGVRQFDIDDLSSERSKIVDRCQNAFPDVVLEPFAKQSTRAHRSACPRCHLSSRLRNQAPEHRPRSNRADRGRR